MSTLVCPADPEADPRVKAVFDDIRAARDTDFINNVWRYLALDPPLLEATWQEVKEVMVKPSALDPLTKENVALQAMQEQHRDPNRSKISEQNLEDSEAEIKKRWDGKLEEITEYYKKDFEREANK